MLEYNHDTEGRAIVAAFPEAVKNKTFLITGPSEGGLGAETAISLASGSPSQLILVGRSPEKIQSVVEAIHAVAPEVLVKIFPANLASISSIRTAARGILEDTSITHIDGLVNNAGVMGIPQFTHTEDGIEEHLGINHVSHFVLTNLLMPLLLVKDVYYDDPAFLDGANYNPWEAYAASKTANILFSVELNRKFGNKGVQAYAVNPGSIHTKLGRYINPDTMKSGLEIHQKHGIERPLPKTLQQGISTGLRALLEPNLPSGSEVYLNDCKFVHDPMQLAAHAIDPKNATRCWNMTETLVHKKFSPI